MPTFQSRWLDWEPPQTPFQRTDKTDRRAFVSSVSASTKGVEGESAPPRGIQKTPPKAFIQRTDYTDKSPCLTEEWDTETAALVEWFERTPAPAQPFQLSPGVFVARPAHFWEALRRDIAAGPNGPRTVYGSLQKDLRRLAALFQSRP